MSFSAAWAHRFTEHLFYAQCWPINFPSQSKLSVTIILLHMSIKTKAREDSEIFVDKIPVIFSAEHLSGSAQIFRNQFNETSKAFSAFYLVPDLNHHLMEGLQFPKESKLNFIFLNSKNYSEKIQKRMELTLDVVKQNHHDVFVYETKGANVYQDFLEVLAYGS